VADELTYRLFFISLAVDVFLPLLRTDKYTRIVLGTLSALLFAVAIFWPSLYPYIPSQLAFSLSDLVMNAWAWFVLILLAPFCSVVLPLIMNKRQSIVHIQTVPNSSPSRALGQRPLIIHSAVYGLGSGQDHEVTERVRELVVNGELHIKVRPETFRMDDPYLNRTKRLFVICSYGEKENVVVSRTDDQLLNLPLDIES
jgi:hypothetical protein